MAAVAAVAAVPMSVFILSIYTYKTLKNTDLHQQTPAQNLTPKMVRQGIQHYAIGKDQTTASKNEIKKRNGGG